MQVTETGSKTYEGKQLSSEPYEGKMYSMPIPKHQCTQSAYVCVRYGGEEVEIKWNSQCNATNASFLPRLYLYASTSLHLHSSIRLRTLSSLLRPRKASFFYQPSFLSLRSCSRPSLGLENPPMKSPLVSTSPPTSPNSNSIPPV